MSSRSRTIRCPSRPTRPGPSAASGSGHGPCRCPCDVPAALRLRGRGRPGEKLDGCRRGGGLPGEHRAGRERGAFALLSATPISATVMCEPARAHAPRHRPARHPQCAAHLDRPDRHDLAVCRQRVERRGAVFAYATSARCCCRTARTGSSRSRIAPSRCIASASGAKPPCPTISSPPRTLARRTTCACRRRSSATSIRRSPRPSTARLRSASTTSRQSTGKPTTSASRAARPIARTRSPERPVDGDRHQDAARSSLHCRWRRRWPARTRPARSSI
jgi:hypothetical protein